MIKQLILVGQKFKSFYTGRYAVITNTITAGTMGCVADAIAQTVEKKYMNNADASWDFSRTRNMTIISTTFGPLVYYWYRFLDTKFPGKSPRMLIKKVSLDLVIAPIWYGFFIGGLCLLKHSSFESGMAEYKNKAPLLIGADLAVWPILQSFNFVFFPPYYRIIGMKLNEILMGIFTSHLINNEYSVHDVISIFTTKLKVCDRRNDQDDVKDNK